MVVIDPDTPCLNGSPRAVGDELVAAPNSGTQTEIGVVGDAQRLRLVVDVAEDLDVLGQLPPGARLTFVPVDPTDLAPLASADAPAGQDADAPAGHEADAPADDRSVPAETEDSP